jgi:hypothetical protein
MLAAQRAPITTTRRAAGGIHGRPAAPLSAPGARSQVRVRIAAPLAPAQESPLTDERGFRLNPVSGGQERAMGDGAPVPLRHRSLQSVREHHKRNSRRHRARTAQ